MAFHVGQKVVCVDDANDGGHRNETMPVKGAVYTIRHVGTFERRNGEIVTGVWLVEIANKPSHYFSHYGERYFRIARFRPVHTTSIEVFRQLLSPIRERETA